MEEMNMKKIYISILAVAAMTLAACNKEQHIDEPVQDVVENNYPVLKAVIDPETKMDLNGTQLSFEVGDVISVFNGIVDETNHHGHCKYKCTSVEDGIAVFEWITADEDADNKYTPSSTVETIVASYPNRSTATAEFEPEGEGYGEGTVKIRMVAGPNGTDSFLPASLPIIAYAQQGELLRFKHTCGLFKLTLKGTAKIAQVKIGSDKVISGNASVPYASENPVLTVLGTGDASKDYALTYTYTVKETVGEETVTAGGVQLTEEGTDMYFGLPVGTHDLTFTFTDTDGKVMRKTAKGLEIKRATITPSALSYVGGIGIDLSSNKTYANCYAVTEPGTYMFDPCKPDGSAVSGTSADWIWASGESCNDSKANTLPASMMKDIKYQDGKIVFTVPSGMKYGNVVLALLDDAKNIQYTWHIWLTEGVMTDVVVGDVTVMDRNLGATNVYDVTVAANAPLQGGKGTFYQWGRKDPFLGARNSTDKDAGDGTAFGSGGNSQYFDINADAGIVNVSAWEYNKTFASTTAEAGAAFPLAMGASKNVPGYDASSTAVWCDRPNANPCPYGYRVINAAEFESLISAGVETSYYNNFGQFTLGGKVMFPRAGYRRGDNGQTATGQTKARYYMNDLGAGSVNQQGAEYAFLWTSAKEYSKYEKYTNTNAYNALSVRCVRVAK